MSTKALFERYETLSAEITAKEKELSELRQQRSDTVKEIFDLEGNVPLKWKGKTLRIAKRENTYFFKGQNNDAKEIA